MKNVITFLIGLGMNSTKERILLGASENETAEPCKLDHKSSTSVH